MTTQPVPAYTIAPLPWVCVHEAGHKEGELWRASTPFGDFEVLAFSDSDHVLASLMLDGTYQRWTAFVSSIADGKAQAQRWNDERLLPALRPVEG